jgi:phage repressor protein C with HTH and peptisase S24 domain
MVKAISMNVPIPEWSKHIERFRARLGVSQAQFGEELQYSAMAISRWERGIQEPPAEAYIKLGKLTTGQDRWLFWERAGLRKTDIQNEVPQPKGAFPSFKVVVASGTKKDIAQKSQLIAIPLLQVHAGSHGEEGDHVLDLSQCPREEVIAAPVAWCPNPRSTTCVRVKGSSMIPSINDGDILAVDSSQTKHADLNNKIVVASHKEKGLTVSRFRHIDGLELLESDNRDNKSVMFSKDRKWQVVGKVLWLIRQAP